MCVAVIVLAFGTDAYFVAGLRVQDWKHGTLSDGGHLGGPWHVALGLGTFLLWVPLAVGIEYAVGVIRHRIHPPASSDTADGGNEPTAEAGRSATSEVGGAVSPVRRTGAGVDGGNGLLGRPGCYFFTGLAFAGAAAAALAAAGLLWSWWWLPWAGVGAGAAALLLWWSWVATDEVISNRCQACGQEYPTRPWSL